MSTKVAPAYELLVALVTQEGVVLGELILDAVENCIPVGSVFDLMTVDVNLILGLRIEPQSTDFAPGMLALGVDIVHSPLMPVEVERQGESGLALVAFKLLVSFMQGHMSIE